MCGATVGNNHFSSDNQGAISERGEKTDVSSLILATLAGTLCPGPTATFPKPQRGQRNKPDALVIVWENCPKFTGSQLKGQLTTD